jgi:hypothetical protein
MKRVLAATAILCFVLELAAQSPYSRQSAQGKKPMPTLDSEDVSAGKKPPSFAPEGGVTELVYESDKGDWVGKGARRYFKKEEIAATFTAVPANRVGPVGSVRIEISTKGGHWFGLWFSTDKMNVNLAPGFYDNAVRAINSTPKYPGLDISANGSGCSSLTGNFRILRADFHYEGFKLVADSFGVEFEQHCEGKLPTFRGHFYYNYAPVDVR